MHDSIPSPTCFENPSVRKRKRPARAHDYGRNCRKTRASRVFLGRGSEPCYGRARARRLSGCAARARCERERCQVTSCICEILIRGTASSVPTADSNLGSRTELVLVKDTPEHQAVDRCEQVHVTAISQVTEWCHVGVMPIVMNGGK